MQIKSIELIEIKMPLVHFFETSFGRTYERQYYFNARRRRATDAKAGAK